MIKPRFEIGQKVFIYKSGKLTPVSIKKAIIVLTEFTEEIEYQFVLESPDSYSLMVFGNRGTRETEVFASKEEFIETL